MKLHRRILWRYFTALVFILGISLQSAFYLPGAGLARTQAVIPTITPTPPPPVILEEPALTPAYKGVCDSAWYRFTNDRAHPAYLTLNVNSAAYSTNSGLWQPVLPVDGVYRVEAYIPAHPAIDWTCTTTRHIVSDTLQASYSIQFAFAQASVIRNQAAAAGTWLSLGDYPLKAGNSGYVRLTDLNGEANFTHTVSFSAMRFTWLRAFPPSTHLPAIFNNAASNVTVLWTSGADNLPRSAFIPGETVRFFASGFNNSPLSSQAHFTWWRSGPCGTSQIFDTLIDLPSGTWSAYQSEVAPACTGVYTYTLQISDQGQSLTYPFRYLVNPPSQAAASIRRAPAFDVCRLPSLADMQVWWNTSPYKVVNLYIGGASLFKTCADNGPTAFWVASASQQGWTFIPTWVGPQAPCSGYGKKMSSDPVAAKMQGRAEADSAVLAMAKNGLSGGGIVYYDLEAYGGTSITQACRNTVKSFASGWVERLHELNFRAGMYGGDCSSYMYDFAAIPTPPDDAWIAAWKTPYQYNPNIGLFNLTCVDDSLWANHQRIRQYAGDHSETWGGVQFGIDSNVMDAEVTLLPLYATPVTQTVTILDQPAPLPAVEIQAFQRISNREGWAIANDRFLWTKDDGSSWGDLTPPGVATAVISAGSFLDHRRGWLMMEENQGSALSLYSTQNAGQTWQKKPFPASLLSDLTSSWSSISLSFVDDQNGWLSLDLVSGSSFSLGALFRTQDGGATWQRLGVPIGGSVQFSDAQHGWITGGVEDNESYRTVDGGQTWQPASLVKENSPDRLSVNQPEGLIQLDMDASGTGWAVTSSGSCSGTKTSLAQDPASLSDTFQCEQHDGLWKTLDGGRTWVEITPKMSEKPQ